MRDVWQCYSGQPSFLQQCVQELSILLHIADKMTYIMTTQDTESNIN